MRQSKKLQLYWSTDGENFHPATDIKSLLGLEGSAFQYLEAQSKILGAALSPAKLLRDLRWQLETGLINCISRDEFEKNRQKRENFDAMLEKFFSGKVWERQILQALRRDLFLLCCIYRAPTEWKKIECYPELWVISAAYLNEYFEDFDWVIHPWVLKKVEKYLEKSHSQDEEARILLEDIESQKQPTKRPEDTTANPHAIHFTNQSANSNTPTNQSAPANQPASPSVNQCASQTVDPTTPANFSASPSVNQSANQPANFSGPRNQDANQSANPTIPATLSAPGNQFSNQFANQPANPSNSFPRSTIPHNIERHSDRSGEALTHGRQTQIDFSQSTSETFQRRQSGFGLPAPVTNPEQLLQATSQGNLGASGQPASQQINYTQGVWPAGAQQRSFQPQYQEYGVPPTNSINNHRNNTTPFSNSHNATSAQGSDIQFHHTSFDKMQKTNGQIEPSNARKRPRLEADNQTQFATSDQGEFWQDPAMVRQAARSQTESYQDAHIVNIMGNIHQYDTW